MSARALLQRFDIVADQTSNIPALRRLVVDLAVRGKLLPIESIDMSVQEMLRRISSKADELVMAGAIKKLKPSSKIGDDEVPAAYLAHCTFERLGNIANLQKGLTGIQSSLPGQFPLVVTAAERGTCDHFDFDGAAAIIPLVSSTGHGNASINRLHYQDGKFALGTILCAVFPFDEQLISARFLFEYLTAFKEELLVSKMIGTANVTLTLGKIADVPVPIVAPAVQKRVDELMALCDQLAAAQHERERRRDRLAAASLQRLNQPAADTTPEAQREHARFHLHHLPRLTTRPEHIKAMRQAIFDLACCGKLSSLTTANHSALPVVVDVDLDFSLPAEWVWKKIGDVADLLSGKAFKADEYSKTGLRLFQIANVSFGVTKWDVLNYLPESYANKLPELMLNAGDLLIALNRPLLNRQIKAAILSNSDLPAILYQRVGKFVFRGYAVVDPKFFLCYLRSMSFINQLEANMQGSDQPFINKSQLMQFGMPFPPIKEQHRIVAKVDELMALCDQLEAQLTTTQTDSRRLLEAVLEAALAPV